MWSQSTDIDEDSVITYRLEIDIDPPDFDPCEIVREGLHGRIPTLEAAPHSPGAGGSHPSVPPGSSGTDRTPGSDPGHD